MEWTGHGHAKHEMCEWFNGNDLCTIGPMAAVASSDDDYYSPQVVCCNNFSSDFVRFVCAPLPWQSTAFSQWNHADAHDRRVHSKRVYNLKQMAKAKARRTKIRSDATQCLRRHQKYFQTFLCRVCGSRKTIACQSQKIEHFHKKSDAFSQHTHTHICRQPTMRARCTCTRRTRQLATGFEREMNCTISRATAQQHTVVIQMPMPMIRSLMTKTTSEKVIRAFLHFGDDGVADTMQPVLSHSHDREQKRNFNCILPFLENWVDFSVRVDWDIFDGWQRPAYTSFICHCQTLSGL